MTSIKNFLLVFCGRLKNNSAIARTIFYISILCIGLVVVPLSIWITTSEVPNSLRYQVLESEKSVHGLLVQASLANSDSNSIAYAQLATEKLISGHFDYADFYSAHGKELGQAKTKLGSNYYQEREHNYEFSLQPEYEFLHAKNDVLIFSSLIPIYRDSESSTSELLGYLELGRVVSKSEQNQLVRIVFLILLLSTGICFVLWPKRFIGW